MAGTLSYRLRVEHVYQRRFDSTSLAEALASSHWYLITRRPSVKIVTDSAWIDDQILTVDFVTRDNLTSSRRVHTLGSDFRQLGTPHDFQVHADGAYFSVRVDGQLIHGDTWALASLLSGANPMIAGQEVLYVGQAFGQDGTSNAWERTQNHKKLQRIYEDHVDTDCEIFVAPLSLEQGNITNDDHIDDKDHGPSLDAYYRTFADLNGRILKPTVDLVEHSLISYFAPHYNEKLTEWRAAKPTDTMRKMRSAGFRLLLVHLSGWWGLARFYSAQEPSPLRSHFISQDLPPEPHRPVLRGIAAEQLSEWRFEAMLAREGKEIFADLAEQTGAAMRVFGDEAPAVRKPPSVTLSRPIPERHEQSQAKRDTAAHEAIRSAIHAAREKERKAHEPRMHTGESSYDPSTGTIAIGEHEDGDTVRLRLHDPETGAVDSTLIIGDPQAGKSNCLRVVISEALATGKFFVIPSDPEDRNDFRRIWGPPVCDDRLIATDVESTIRNLAMARQIMDKRRAASDYTNPSREIPGCLFAIDDADAVLQDVRGACLVGHILSAGGEVGVGLLLVVSDILALESDSTLMRHLVSCHTKAACMPDGQFIVADLTARHGERRSQTWRDDGPSFVLHRGPQVTTLGLVTAVTGPEATPAEAQSWCDKQLGAYGISVMDWKLVEHEPMSWWTMAYITLQRWSLRRHQDAWALIMLLSNTPTVIVPQGADALRWATEAINNLFAVDLAPWCAGPTTGEEGLSVLYADVTGDIVAKDRSESIMQMLLDAY